MKFGCIGEHLKHSFSKEIHAHIAEYEYEIVEVPREKLGEFMMRAPFEAINVTIPYKEAVMPYLYEISDVARSIGAVNTIVNRGGKLYGYNTDFYGMRDMIVRMGVSLADEKVAVLGTGGTAKTAASVARSLGCRECLLVSRTPRDGVITKDVLYKDHSDVGFVINCTPVGMFPNPGEAPIDVSLLPNLKGIADAVYNPLKTELYMNAERAGIPVKCGLYMLVRQAVVASEIFTNTKYEDGISEEIYRRVRKSKENIVLTGMPASGKSTVGALLSRDLGREVVDTDAVIEARAGMKISEIFEKSGEGAFRDIESRVIDEVSNRNGIIISTGGGAILREENVKALHRNGVVFFLDRLPENLVPTDTRPLASSVEQIFRRYAERYEKYKSSADFTVDSNVDVEIVAENVRREFFR